MSLSLLSKFTIPTCKFPLTSTSNSYTLVNKFGIHQIKNEASLDSGYGFVYRNLKNKTINFQDYIKNHKQDDLYNEIESYIKQSAVPLDRYKKAKLHIKIENHAFPLIQMTPNSVIYQDNTPIFKNENYCVNTITDHPKIEDYKSIQLHAHIVDKKSTLTCISECTTLINANQWCMLYWKSHFNGNFITFCDANKLQLPCYTRNQNFELLPYAPGGITNIGTFDIGQANEYFITGDAEYNLTFTVSPAIKIKTNDYFNSLRYPPQIYPYIQGKTKYNLAHFTPSFSTELHADIIEGASNDVYFKKQWHREHNFGIDIQFKKMN